MSPRSVGAPRSRIAAASVSHRPHRATWRPCPRARSARLGLASPLRRSRTDRTGLHGGHVPALGRRASVSHRRCVGLAPTAPGYMAAMSPRSRRRRIGTEPRVSALTTHAPAPTYIARRHGELTARHVLSRLERGVTRRCRGHPASRVPPPRAAFATPPRRRAPNDAESMAVFAIEAPRALVLDGDISEWGDLRPIRREQPEVSSHRGWIWPPVDDTVAAAAPPRRGGAAERTRTLGAAERARRRCLTRGGRDHE
jgi:hypothetical protein